MMLNNEKRKPIITSKRRRIKMNDTVLQSVMSTDSLLEAEFIVILQSSTGSLCVTHSSPSLLHSMSHEELSGGKSFTAASTLSRLTQPSSADGSSTVQHCDIGRRSLLTNSSGKLCRQQRMSSWKWKPSVSACLEQHITILTIFITKKHL